MTAADVHGNRPDVCGVCVLLPTVSGHVRSVQTRCPVHGSALAARRQKLTGVEEVWTGRLAALEREDGDLYLVAGRRGGDRIRGRISRAEAMVLAAILARETARDSHTVPASKWDIL